MKSPLIWICIAAIAGSLTSSSAIGRTSNSTAADTAVGGVALDTPAPVAPRAHGKAAAPPAHSELRALKGAVVSEMRATKAFVKENVVKEQAADKGLMLLAAIGMMVLQLRRKHKSLPQRQIAPYA